jgi:hypothetical protein
VSSTLLVGLVSWYRFDANLLDSSGNGHTLDDTGNPVTYTTGLIGQAAEAGSGRREPADLPVSGDFTVAFWVRRGANNTSLRWFCRFSTTDVFGVRFSAGGFWQIVLNAGATNTVAALLDTWQLAVARFSISAGLSCTRAELSVDAGAFISASVLPQTVNSAWRDVFAFSAGSLAFRNDVDLAGVWDRLLTTDEVDELYNGGAGFDPTA